MSAKLTGTVRNLMPPHKASGPLLCRQTDRHSFCAFIANVPTTITTITKRRA
jgi:hypothetical protein